MSKTFHILNGDALLEFFPESILSGEIIVARECLVDGSVTGTTLEEFWETRADFISAEYEEEKESYFFDVVSEFNRISLIPPGSEVNLWFEEDLFCQVNLWFCMSLLTNIADQLKINLVKPPLKDGQPDWGGFGGLDRNELAGAYQSRERLFVADVKLLTGLWHAYKTNDRVKLKELSTTKSAHFPFLQDVVQAQLDRSSEDSLSGRPEKVLKEIMLQNNIHDFKAIFKEFSIREGIYGFGDWQVERLLNKLPEFKAE
ncbi:DUF1835 domain-containing protein [Dyadobacter sp. NIV53]|uniref:DUF1835 domain-containing protein n=1 Tax=Dyadobacter sp. NIV53 TaxID=2861765 RepID=UPI001C88970B|nr:DUF1835 domain-containing protein [Dyadobacter sp. NIV53]